MSAAYQPEAAEQRATRIVEEQTEQLVGDQLVSQTVGTIIENLNQDRGVWSSTLVSILGVCVGATGLVAALQNALNQVWKVRPKRGHRILRFFLKRLVSLVVLVGFGALLLFSFLITATLNTMNELVTQNLGLGGPMPQTINQLATLLTTFLFFLVIFRFMPDARVRFKHAVLGAIFTAALFTLGRYGLFYYFAHANPAAQLGAAATSLVLILVWVYYSATVLLFGAEFTASLCRAAEESIAPEDGAECFEECTVTH